MTARRTFRSSKTLRRARQIQADALDLARSCEAPREAARAAGNQEEECWITFEEIGALRVICGVIADDEGGAK